MLRIDPAAAWLRSEWPVDRIWAANQPDADPNLTVDLTGGSVRLEIRRREDAVAMRRLDAASFAFRTALDRGATLESATTIALAEDSAFDLPGALRALLHEGLIVGLTLEPIRSEGEPA